jgi:hypothetical protein
MASTQTFETQEDPVNAAALHVDSSLVAPVTLPQAGVDSRADHAADLERAVDYVLDDCFFTVGQVIGTRKTLEYDTVVWWRDHYRMKFLRAMEAFGNRWLQDRDNVTGVAFMLAERAVRYADTSPSVDLNSAQRAAADVERYCELHSRRAARAHGKIASDGNVPVIAGYWCVPAY